MPRVMKKPTFKPDELVIACEPFAAPFDGSLVVANPGDVRRGDDPLVRQYPHMFRRQGDQQALAEYRAAVYAEEQERRAGEQREVAKLAAEQRKRVEALADKLEPEERARLKKLAREQKAGWDEKTESKRRRREATEKELQEAHEYGLAMAEVERRLANERVPS